MSSHDDRPDVARISIEARLREAQKTAAISTIAGGIARELNNSITTILGNVELARQDMASHPRALESLEEIRSAGARARALVQQVLSFSRRQPTERKLLVLAPLIEESMHLLHATLPARVTLEVECDANVPAVFADPAQIEQIAVHLVVRATHAVRHNPVHIDVRVDAVLLDEALARGYPALRRLHAQHPGRAARLTVSDNGPGMDAITREGLFEPVTITKRPDENSALSLAELHDIVQAHDAAMVVDSEPGEGTKFALYLAAAGPQVSAAAAATASAAPAMGGGRRILYLDDDISLVHLVERHLERRGFRVSGYIDQQEALEALRANPARFDFGVLDYHMPGMSGPEVARQMRAIRADLRVAVASGVIDDTLREDAARAGVPDLIFKASQVEDFCDAIARLAKRGR